MNFIKLLLSCLFIVSIPTLACQQGGTCYGHHDRKLSKRDLHVGPDQRQKHKQDLWEMAKAKRDQKVQKDSPSEKLATGYAAYSKLLAHAIAMQSTDDHSHCSVCPISCPHPFMAAALCTLLFITPCAGLYPIRYDCVNLQNFLAANKDYCIARRQFAMDNKEVLGGISLPEFVEMKCPPIDDGLADRHWRTDHAYDWYQRGKSFWEEFQQKDAELTRRINEINKRAAAENKHANIHNQVVAVNQYMDGKYHHLKAEHEKSLHAFLKDPAAFVSRSQKELDADPLITLGAITQTYVKRIKPSDAIVDYTNLPWNYESRFIALMRSGSAFIIVAKNIIRELATGSYSAEIKAHAQAVDEAIQKELINPPQLAREVDYLTDQTKNHGIDRIHLEARLDELSLGFLHTADELSYCTFNFCSGRPLQITTPSCGKNDMPFLAGTRILCSSDGRCGISDAIAAQLGGAKTDFELIDSSLKDFYVHVHSAQDVRRIFMYQGEYVGRTYVGGEPVNSLIRSMEGGRQTASKVFKFCARGNEITEAYSSESNTQIYKFTLADGTKVTYYPINKNGDSVIKITDMPAWICQDPVEFRFIN